MEQGFFDSIEDASLVDSRSFEVLEHKIIEVLDRLKTVQEEKADLQRQFDALKAQYDESAQQVEDLTREREVLQRNQRNVEQEELIRSKISALLAKLETA
jgi:FtsZ-binding cell division protein ZapB